MHTKARRFWREPLVWFAVFGALIYVASSRAELAETEPEASAAIVVDAATVEALRSEFIGRHGERPTPEQEAALIRQHALDEALYREALELGLDRGDLIVRRRLVQKMRFVIEGSLAIAEPSDAELAELYARRAPELAPEPRYSFRHVFHRDPGSAELDWEQGEPFFYGTHFEARRQDEIAARFGRRFAEVVVAAAPGEWSEPVRSSYGLHRILVERVDAPPAPPLAQVRERLAQEWRDAAIARATRAYDDRLLARHGFRVEAARDQLASSESQ